ncbi:phage portal protein [Vibrio parahaemolyticus]
MILDHQGNPLSSEKSFSNYNYDFSFMHSGFHVAGVDVSPLKAYQHGIVYSCIRVLAESIGQLPVRLYKRTESGRERVLSHRMLSVLTQMPNDYMTWQELLEMIVTHLNLDGNFYAYVNKNRNGKIVEIIPIPTPSSVSILMQKGTIKYQVAPDTVIKLPKSTFSANEILHIKGSSIDGLRGITPIQNAAKTVGLSLAAEKHGEEFFNNSATPNGYLTTDGKLSAEAIERLRENWAQNFQGLRNSSKTAVFEEGMEYKPIAISHRDSQFLETREFQKKEICSIFRVPTSMAGVGEQKYSNYEQAVLSFHRDTLMPLITRIVSRLNAMLPDDLEVQLDDTQILRGDSKTQADVIDKHFKNGLLSINEAREQLGLDAIAGGDVRAIVTNNITLGNLTDLDKRQTTQQPTSNNNNEQPEPESGEENEDLL